MNLSQNEIIDLLTDENEEALYREADEVRHRYVGDKVHLRGLVEFSNICRRNCLYCGIRAGNSCVKRYRMEAEDIIAAAQRAVAAGFKTIVLQSGEDMYYTSSRLCRIIESIKKLDIAVTLSIGERDYNEYRDFREAGADRYLMRIETTDCDLYHRLDPGMDWQQRYECLLMIKELGYELGSGIMVGLPGQSVRSLAKDLLFLQKLDVDMAGIGPFIPHLETPLAHETGGSLSLALKTMSVMRLLLPNINIPATTAMESLHPEGRIMALQAGANVVMLNAADEEYQRNYELYPGKNYVENLSEVKEKLQKKLEELGRTIGEDVGTSKHYKKSNKMIV